MTAKLARDAKQNASHEFFENSIHLPSRTLYMGSVFAEEEEAGTDYRMAERMVKGLFILENAGDDEITILMNNPGGYEFHGIAIYDAIRDCSSRVVIKVFGMAMSMGSIILQAADERIMSPNSKIMIHYGTWDGWSDHPKILATWYKENKEFVNWMQDVYMEKMLEKAPKMTKAKLDKLLDFDTIYTAQQSVDIGLADKILGV